MSVQAVVLAGGSSRRMNGPNKLAAFIGDKPLIRQTVEHALASRAEQIFVVTGHEAERISDLLVGLPVVIVHNPDHRSGLSSSLKTGIRHLPASASGALIMLGDMPTVESRNIDHLITSFCEADEQCVVRASHNGKRGNPVILPRSLFDAALELQGDVGARYLIEEAKVAIIDIEIGSSALTDVDTQDDLLSLGGSV